MMGKHAIRRGIVAVTLLLSVFSAAHAQEFRGSITGHVTDPSGGALPGATVTVKNVDTNVENTVTINDDGSYSFPLLQPGKYTLRVTNQGFSAAVREGIEVRVADKLTIDMPLQVGGVTETVTTVASTTPALETGSVTAGSTITSRQISELPLTEGTAYQLAMLAPGVSYAGNPLFTGPTSNGNLNGVLLDNVRVTAKSGMTIQGAKAVELRAVRIAPQKGDPLTITHAEVKTDQK
jgi:hypothetical protein